MTQLSEIKEAVAKVDSPLTLGPKSKPHQMLVGVVALVEASYYHMNQHHAWNSGYGL